MSTSRVDGERVNVLWQVDNMATIRILAMGETVYGHDWKDTRNQHLLHLRQTLYFSFNSNKLTRKNKVQLTHL